MTAEILTDEELFAPAAPVDDLADLLAELGDRAQQFRVCDEASAAWVVDKLIGYDERRARVKAQSKAMLDEIDRDQARFGGRFLPELEDWYRHTPRKGKSIKLLTGTIAMRTVPGRWIVDDDEETAEWARENLPAAVGTMTRYVLDTDALKSYAQTTGEVVPGMAYIEPRESFSVKAPAAAKKEG